VSRTSEPARRHAPRQDGVPETAGVFVHAGELDALLARVAGAVDHHLDPVEQAELEREGLAGLEAEALERARPLNGEERVLVRDVAHVRAAQLAFLQPGVVGVAVRSVDDDEVAVLVEPVDDHVVDDPARLGRDQRVLRGTRPQLVDVVGERRLDQVARRRALDLELAHVRDVEDAGVGPHRPVLGDHAGVLDGHLPPGERHHPRAERNVTVVERCPAERLHRGRC
jgi:hypothetical protein